MSLTKIKDMRDEDLREVERYFHISYHPTTLTGVSTLKIQRRRKKSEKGVNGELEREPCRP